MSRDEDVFAEARNLPADERASFLVRACADDPAGRGRVEELLAGYAETERALPKSLFAHEFRPLEEKPGDKIDRYKLLEKIGEGGCGAVWMAEQEEPVRRRVALKVIKLGMDTKEVIARFEAERQALALMDHPNIARIFDAGTTDAGRPFFVMEFVRGIPITRFCDDASLPTEMRLQLFSRVCHAIQHAHQKGVIHRDIKPSNILVTMLDDTAVPKVIDFGIAKATSTRLTDKTLFTRIHAFIGTPTYTSPEQMEMSGVDVDTRSDIYSLGVLLYELLTGQPPFDSEALLKSGLESMRRTIREIDPPKPSYRLGTLSDLERTSVAQQRGTDAAKLSVLLRGDLDWIAMRCLEKDRTRRYASAAGLAADIERHLSNDLVEARPPSQFYRTTKFIRRHKVGVFAVAAIAVSMIAGLIASSTLFVRERSAHNRAALAEEKQSELRRQAEVVAAGEVKRAARTALDLANQKLAEGRVADGLAYLVYASRKDPKNGTLGPRLASALAMHNFLLPEGQPFECGSRVLALRFTKDGQSIYVGTEDGTFRVLDATSGRLRREFRLGRSVMLTGWEFPRDNDSVFAARFENNTLGVFDVETGAARWTPLALDVRVWKDNEYLALGRAVGISADGRWLYALASHHFWIWDAATGRVLLDHQLDADRAISSCEFSNNGSQVSITFRGSVGRWTLPDGVPSEKWLAFERATGAATVRYSPDDQHVVLAYFTGVAIFNATTGDMLRELRLPGAYLNSPSVVFASNSRVFGAGGHPSGSWDLKGGEFKPLPIGLGADVISTSFDAAGRRILSVNADGFLRICDLESGELITQPTWRQDRVVCAALAADGLNVVVGTRTSMVQRLRVGRGAAQPLVLPRELKRKLPAPFLPESPTRLLWMTSVGAQLIDAVSARKISDGFVYPRPFGWTSWMDWDSPVRSDVRFMAVPTPDEWHVWELGENRVINTVTLVDSNGAAGPIRFSPVGDLVALRFDIRGDETGKLGVWNLRSGLRAGPQFSFPSALTDMSPNFSPDGKRLALGTADGACMIVEVATGRTLVRFATRSSVPNASVWFSPDGGRVFTANVRSEARIWDAATGEPISRVQYAESAWGGARFTPDGRRFATWGLHTTRLWDGETGAPVGETIPAGGRMIRFSDDSRSLATADDRGFAQVWDIPSGQAFTEPMRPISPNPDYLNSSPAISSNGRFFRAQTRDEYHIWSLPPRLAEGMPVPDWLLQLATVLATKRVDDAGQLVDVPEAMNQFHDVRRQIMALPADAPLAEWGRWILDARPHRSIAPGFTCTPEEAEKLAAVLKADLATVP